MAQAGGSTLRYRPRLLKQLPRCTGGTIEVQPAKGRGSILLPGLPGLNHTLSSSTTFIQPGPHALQLKPHLSALYWACGKSKAKIFGRRDDNQLAAAQDCANYLVCGIGYRPTYTGLGAPWHHRKGKPEAINLITARISTAMEIFRARKNFGAGIIAPRRLRGRSDRQRPLFCLLDLITTPYQSSSASRILRLFPLSYNYI